MGDSGVSGWSIRDHASDSVPTSGSSKVRPEAEALDIKIKDIQNKISKIESSRRGTTKSISKLDNQLSSLNLQLIAAKLEMNLFKEAVKGKKGASVEENSKITKGQQKIDDLALLSKLTEMTLKFSESNTDEDAMKAYIAILEIIQKMDNINVKDENGNTPLHVVCSSNIPDILTILLELSANTHELNNEDMTPLMCACQHGSSACIEYILRYNPSLASDIPIDQILDSDGNTLVHYACKIGNFDIIDRCLQEDKKLLFKQNESGTTPFYEAVTSENKNDNIIKYLLKKTEEVLTEQSSLDEGSIDVEQEIGKLDKELKDFLLSETVLCNANLTAIKLVENGANCNIPCEFGVKATVFLVALMNINMHEAAKIMLINGADTNITVDGLTPLHFACISGDVDLFEELLDQGINPLAKGDIGEFSGVNVLMYAAITGNKDILEILLNRCSLNDLSEKSNDGLTVLDYAIDKNIPDITRILLKLDAPCDKNIKNLNCLISYYSNKDLTEDEKVVLRKKIGEMIRENPELLNEQDADGNTPLLMALQYAENENLILDIFSRAEVDLKITNNQGDSIIDLAVSNGFIALAVKLVEISDITMAPTIENLIFLIKNFQPSGAYKENIYKIVKAKPELINEENANDETPLQMIIANKVDTSIIEFLINNNLLKPDGEILLHAIKYGNPETVKLLIENGANPNTVYEDGNTLLIKAFLDGKSEMIECLIANGADINQTDKNGRTLLHNSILHGKVKLTELLVEHKAILDIPDEEGITPLTIALEMGYLGCVQILLNNGIKLSEANKLKFGDIKIEDLSNTFAMDKLIDTACTLQKEQFTSFLKMAQKLRGENPSILTTSSASILDEFSKKVDEISRENLLKIPNNKNDFDEFTTKILSEFLELYLDFVFNELKNHIIKLLPKQYSNRYSNLESTLAALHKSNKDEQIDLLKKQSNHHLETFEKILEKDRLKTQDEMTVFLGVLKYEHPMPGGERTMDDLYLGEGVCVGGVLALANARIQGNSIEGDSMQLSARSRFFQAAYDMKRDLPEALEKKLKKQFKSEGTVAKVIDESVQRRMGINVEPIEGLSKLTVIDFIQSIETLIPKLCTEKSPHFYMDMGGSKEEEAGTHSWHAVYCHLSSPYEIQDVNYPGFSSLKTEDINQFKMYLLFYFLLMAPSDYQEIGELCQISKRY